MQIKAASLIKNTKAASWLTVYEYNSEAHKYWLEKYYIIIANELQ